MELKEYKHTENEQELRRLFLGESKELDPFYIFQKKYGELKSEKALFYFIRRFGFKQPFDSYKSIANYLFKTSENVIVDIGFSSIGVSVYFELEHEAMMKIYMNHFKNPQKKYYADFLYWLNEKNYKLDNFEKYVLPFIRESIAVLEKTADKEYLSKDLLYKSFKKISDWEAFVLEYPNFIDSLMYRHKEAYDSFSLWFGPKEKEFIKETGSLKPDINNIYNNCEVDKYREHCLEVLQEFLKPTNIRDVYYNIYGEVKDNISLLKCVDFYDYNYSDKG